MDNFVNLCFQNTSRKALKGSRIDDLLQSIDKTAERRFSMVFYRGVSLFLAHSCKPFRPIDFPPTDYLQFEQKSKLSLMPQSNGANLTDEQRNKHAHKWYDQEEGFLPDI